MKKEKANMKVNCSKCVYRRKDGRFCINPKGKYFGTISQIYCREYKDANPGSTTNCIGIFEITV